MSKCKGCGAEIEWVKMRTGGIMPVDAKPIKVVVVNRELHSDDPPGAMITAFMQHWATCPKADQFKKKAPDTDKIPMSYGPDAPV